MHRLAVFIFIAFFTFSEEFFLTKAGIWEKVFLGGESMGRMNKLTMTSSFF